ncbi:MAG: inorganic phosphate transporter family protein [Candidatus Omnitrophica bacterium]|nr:inorganic phosphate transporter family protein [Candidatus Omnitrophota bacterium]
MLSPMFSILLIPFLAAMFLAINMGGSGTAPSFSAAYGSNIIRKDLIPGLFGLFVFFGAILAGKKVVLTVGKGILPGEMIGLTLTTIILLSVGLSLLLANLLKIPQSTSQATISALIGPAVYFNVLKTHKLFFEILPTWFILPIVSFIITLFIGKFIYNPMKHRKIIKFKEISTHPILKIAVILTSCYVAFAIGSNNVANAAGPIASMISNELNIIVQGDKFVLIMILSTLIIAPCFAIGSSLFGGKLVETTGKEIINIGPLGACLIAGVTATLLLLASVTRGIPTSLVQMNTMAIIGLGISKVGWKEMFTHTTVKKLLIIWIIAPVLALFLSFSLTVLADKVGLL